MTRPAFVTLRLTTPRMGAPDASEEELVLAVQSRLRDVPRTGVFDCATSAAVQRWQWQQGAPVASGAIAPAELVVLLGYEQRPASWLTRAVERAGGEHWSTPPDPVSDRCRDPRPAAKLVVVPRRRVGLMPARATVAATHRPGVPFVLHWQGEGRGAVGLEASFAQLRGFQRRHMLELGWSDIGYGWALPRGCPVGTVIELRGRGVRGAHCGDEVGNAYPGVLVMMGADDERPTDDQLDTLEMFRTAERWGRATGHLEWSPTSCPGPALMAWVRANR